MTDRMPDEWYHWSPTARRKRINKVGLMPNMLSTDGLWKPPYICLASTPSLAWGLSGWMGRPPHIAEWDLWQVYTGEQTGFEVLYFDGERTNTQGERLFFFDQNNVKEIRVYERIYKRNVWYVASRTD